MLQYKAQEAEIKVILTEESYTSGTSFPDDEMPVKQNYRKTRRIHRGLFVSENGIKMNADIEKSIPDSLRERDRGCGVTSSQSKCSFSINCID